MSSLAWAAAAGTAGALGLLLTLAALPAFNQPRMAERVAPYVQSAVAVELAPRSSTPLALGGAARIFLPLLQRAAAMLEKLNLESEQLRRRLLHAGSGLTPVEYRLQQLGWAAAGAALASAANLLAALSGGGGVLHWVLGTAAAAVLGPLARDQLLAAQIRRRRQRMLAEFPTVAEMIALAVGAGDTASGAFARIGRGSHGVLSGELRQLQQQIAAGSTFSRACRDMAARVDVVPVQRFLDGVLVAVERGTPLAEVMHAQAADVRELSRRELMESAGRKEVGMLAPVVFGILPLTILFAVFPGMSLLSIGI